jgi:hypothetical protein
MFQAEAGSGNAASVRRTRDTITVTAVSYAISVEYGARKKGSGQLAANYSKESRENYKKLLSFTNRITTALETG